MNKTILFTSLSSNKRTVYGMRGDNNATVKVNSKSITQYKAYVINGTTPIQSIFTYPQSINSIEIAPNTIVPTIDAFNLTNLIFNNNNPSEIPILPSTVKYVNTEINSLEGTVPIDLLVNNPFNLRLDLSNNIGLNGNLSNDFCYIQSLNIVNTSITAIPDCLWCFQSSGIFNTTLEHPETVLCKPPTFDSLNLVSYQGRFIINGDLLGYGDIDQGLSVIRPNKQLYGQMDPSQGRKQTKKYSLWPETFTIEEISFVLDNATLNPLDKVHDNLITITAYFKIISNTYLPNISFGMNPCTIRSFLNNSIFCTVDSSTNNNLHPVQIFTQFQNNSLIANILPNSKKKKIA
ncbi:hypothetical protein DFA_02140 [Cavenderia fasciculata]|uniref:Uncharacterized protein n=1 Tax=Cavenderia fasciculata TaxID=261658 RepID=F4PYT7_CACFS|nr:uncharacterized protein DFA_02140 [Cavenderia fasciculata]EGG19353.1 hypothetical protein DFA_02140 [Cavenderia fasciculata]|eukprot:XP_004357624.1 hypothetical protein DFA_02140 [Cavenderia fasciculata]